MNQTSNKLAEAPMNRLVWSISFPLMLSMLIQSLYNIVDGIFVARISEQALNATSLAYPVQMLMIAVSVGTGVGINALLSQTLGRGERDKVANVAGNGLFSALCGSLAFVVLGLVAVRPFLRIFTSDPEVLTQGTAYLSICMIFCPGIFFAATGERLLQASGKTWLSMTAQTVGALCNVILDPVFVFGFGLGVPGAAIATVAGQWAAAVAALWLNRTRNPEVPIHLSAIRLDGKIIKSIYRVGLPTMITQASGSLMVFGMNKILAGFSVTAVNFFGVYYKLQNFLYMPINGLAQGLIPIVGYNWGAGNRRRTTEALRVALSGAVALMLCGTAVFCLFPAQLLGLFSAGEELLAIGVPGLRTISLVFALTGVTVTIGYYFSGLGDGTVNMITSLLRQLVLLLPLAWAFGRLWGVSGVWYAFWIAEAAAFAFAVARCVRDLRSVQNTQR